MENTFPTHAELDAVTEALSAARKRYDEAKRTFEADYQRRKSEVARKRADLDKELDELRTRHAAAMQAVGVAIAEGLDGDLETERADNIAADIFKLEQRAKALATLTVKADDALFEAVLTAYKGTLAAKDTARKDYSAVRERAKAAAEQFAKLEEEAGKQLYWLGLSFGSDDEIVMLYESIRGPIDGPNHLKARTIANM